MSDFLFVHGGMVGGWCWKKICNPLERKGHRVFTPTLSGLGDHLTDQSIDLELHISEIVNYFIENNLQNVVLVGHSYGGMVINGVADRFSQKIKKLVYLDALIPKHGESMFDLVDPHIAAFICQEAKEKGNGSLVPPPPPQAYGIEDPLDVEWFSSLSKPHPLLCFQQKLILKTHALSKLEKIFIKCTRDHSLDPMLQRARELAIPCLLLDTGHFPMVTHPETLVSLLLKEC